MAISYPTASPWTPKSIQICRTFAVIQTSNPNGIYSTEEKTSDAMRQAKQGDIDWNPPVFPLHITVFFSHHTWSPPYAVSWQTLLTATDVFTKSKILAKMADGASSHLSPSRIIRCTLDLKLAESFHKSSKLIPTKQIVNTKHGNQQQKCWVNDWQIPGSRSHLPGPLLPPFYSRWRIAWPQQESKPNQTWRVCQK